MENNILKIIEDINTYEKKDLDDLIKERLEKNLTMYIRDIQLSFDHLAYNRRKKRVIKELYKNETDTN